MWSMYHSWCYQIHKYRNKLYKNLKVANEDSLFYAELKKEWNIYNKILKTTLHEAKYIYYSRQFEENKANIK